MLIWYESYTTPPGFTSFPIRHSIIIPSFNVILGLSYLGRRENKQQIKQLNSLSERRSLAINISPTSSRHCGQLRYEGCCVCVASCIAVREVLLASTQWSCTYAKSINGKATICMRFVMRLNSDVSSASTSPAPRGQNYQVHFCSISQLLPNFLSCRLGN
jgi:hypothetical protein